MAFQQFPPGGNYGGYMPPQQQQQPQFGGMPPHQQQQQQAPGAYLGAPGPAKPQQPMAGPPGAFPGAPAPAGPQGFPGAAPVNGPPQQQMGGPPQFNGQQHQNGGLQNGQANGQNGHASAQQQQPSATPVPMPQNGAAPSFPGQQQQFPGQAPRPAGPPQPAAAPAPSPMPQQMGGAPQMPGQMPGAPQMGGPPQMPGQMPGAGAPHMGGAPPAPQMSGMPSAPKPMGAPGAMPPQMGAPAGPPGMPGFPGQQQQQQQRPQQPGFPGAPGGAPQGFPPGPGAPAQGFPPGPPGAPGAPQGFGAPAPGGFPPGPGGPGFPPGPGGPAGFPPGPGGPGAYPGGPGAPMGAPGQFGGQPQFGGPPGMGGMAPGMPPQQRQRLDPNMMPSAVQVMEDDAVRAGVFPTGYPTAEAPPLVSTSYYAQDQGNCNPKFMRSTMYVAPQSNDMLKATQIPFAVAVSPFAALNENERAPPVIDLGPQGPIRCQRCKAYMCPFMEFQDGGRRFKCPFCNASTPVEESYFAHLDHTGRRTDIEHRPELYLGAYEFVATKPYCKNGVAPKEPAFIFMVDVSYTSMSNGLLHTICQNLERVLANLPKELGQSESAIRVGLATFDQSIHFYDLAAPQPSMMVVGDVSDVFVPIVDGLLLPYAQAAPAIRAVLAELPRLFAQNKTTETMVGPVVQAGLDALKSADRAGKLFVFSCSLPTFEAPGKLKNRDDRKLLGTDKEKSILTPQTEFYTKLGEQCVKGGCSVDLFLFPNAFIDVATLGQLCAVTGGSLYKYQYFEAAKDAPRLLHDLQHDVSRQLAFDCMVRVRSSAGIRPVTFQGSFYMENSTDLEMAVIDQDKAFFCELRHDDKLSNPTAVVQTACLFTSCSGQRRLRILNMCLPVSSDYNQLYRVADQDALATMLLKSAVEQNREKGLKDVRDSLAQKCATMLSAYREKCSEQAPLGQLILPESLKLLPLFANSILKNDAVSGGSEMTVDDKAWMMELIRGIRVEDAMMILYPKVVPVSDVEMGEGDSDLAMPQPVRASVEFMQNTKAYLIDNGLALFLWVGLGVPEAWVQDVFGSNSVALIDTESHHIPEKDNAKSRALRRVMATLNKGAARQRKVFVIREKDALEPWMKKFLVEDKSGPNGMSYVDYLCFIHREIRSILS